MVISRSARTRARSSRAKRSSACRCSSFGRRRTWRWYSCDGPRSSGGSATGTPCSSSRSIRSRGVFPSPWSPIRRYRNSTGTPSAASRGAILSASSYMTGHGPLRSLLVRTHWDSQAAASPACSPGASPLSCASAPVRSSSSRHTRGLSRKRQGRSFSTWRADSAPSRSMAAPLRQSDQNLSSAGETPPAMKSSPSSVASSLSGSRPAALAILRTSTASCGYTSADAWTRRITTWRKRERSFSVATPLTASSRAQARRTVAGRALPSAYAR